MDKIIVAMVTMCFTFPVLSQEKSPFSGITKEHYSELEERMKEEVASKEVTAQADTPKDWSDCRDACYDERNECFDRGGETHICEEVYDSCAEWCDENY